MPDNIETMIAAAVERGVLAAFAKYQTVAIPIVETTSTEAPAPAPEAKKPGRPKKAENAPQANAEPSDIGSPAPATENATAAPLPAPATPPAAVTANNVEADRAKLIELAGRIPSGRKVATEIIKVHGPKFDDLAADIRAAILEDLEALANEQAGA